MAYSRTIAINGLAAGLTLKGALITGSTIHATFRDVAFTAGSSSGSYYLASSAWPDSYRGRLVLYTGTVGAGSDFSGVTVYAPEIAINPEDSENLSAGIHPTAATIADAVWDEALSGHATAGTAGKALSDIEDEGTITVAPILATSNQTRYTVKDMAAMIAGSGQADQWTITDSTGAAASQAGDTIRFVVAGIEYATLNADPFSDDFTAAWTRQTGGDGVVISGASNNIITVTQDPANVVAGEYVYWLLNITDRIPLAAGKLPVKPIVAGAWA